MLRIAAITPVVSNTGDDAAPPDLLIMVGAISGCVLLFMLVSKIIPVVSIWEVGEGLRLVKVRRYLNRYARVIAKSH